MKLTAILLLALGLTAFMVQVGNNRLAEAEVYYEESKRPILAEKIWETFRIRHDAKQDNADIRRIIRKAVVIEGVDWDKSEIDAMLEICWRESRYDHTAEHPVSSATGLWQFLDSTWEYVGIPRTFDPLLQTVAAVRYIDSRYGTPTRALEFHKTPHLVNGRLVHYY